LQRSGYISGRGFLSLLAFAMVCIQPMGANAQAVDQLLEGAKICTRPLQRYEREYGIPSHLLSAIASTESGRYHKGLKIKLPWPRTINAEGKGYYFDSKEEAMAAANKMRARGVQSMDLGCMQVNIMHHPHAFSSISEAFDPEHNVAYAASFLRQLYQEEGSWKQAAADYHSKTPQLGNEYVGNVYNSWFRIIDKLRAARLNIPESSVNGLRDMASADTPYGAKSVVSSPKKVTISSQGKEVSTYKTASSKSVKLGSYKMAEARSRQNGVIVVKPMIKVVDAGSVLAPNRESVPQPMVMAAASTVNQSSKPAEPQQPSAKIIRLDNKLLERKAPVAQTQRSGPNFIFND